MPPTMACPVATNSPSNVIGNHGFAGGTSTLSPLQLSQIQNLVNLWHDDGSNKAVRVDGYASVDGSQSLNWQLSCDRAHTVVNELHTPSNGAPGIPLPFITIFAQGESDELSSNALNRRATISANIATPVTPTCTLTGHFTTIPNGTLAVTFSGSKLGASFSMVGEFVATSSGASCNCSCGEYRQFVRGEFKANGSTVPHSLCGTPLDPITVNEDCGRVGGTDMKYGYRSIPFGTSRFTNPDQATGCTFNGFDHPGISNSPSGTVLEVDLDFIGQLVDTCNGDRELARADWSVKGTDTVP